MAPSYTQENHKLRPSQESREAIADAMPNDPVTIDRSGKLLRFLDAQGRPLGALTTRHQLAARLQAGEPLLHCSVAWTYPASDRYPHGLASAQVVTGDPDDAQNQWMLREVWGKPRQPSPTRSYPVGIVGGSHYRAAISGCREGDAVTLCREIGNPHDDRAIVVKSSAGATIGYLPRDSWLQPIVHDDGCGAIAVIKSLYLAPTMRVVLDVTVATSPLEAAPYLPHRAAD